MRHAKIAPSIHPFCSSRLTCFVPCCYAMLSDKTRDSSSFLNVKPPLEMGGRGLISPPLKVLKMHYFDVAMPRNIIEKKNFK